MSYYRQLSIFDWQNEQRTPQEVIEPEVGEWVENHGANICHIMRSSYIGKKVIMDKSTENHKWFQCGILEKYFFNAGSGRWRGVIYHGERQRALYDFFPGHEIFECLPWDAYPKRMEAIGRKGRNAMQRLS